MLPRLRVLPPGPGESGRIAFAGLATRRLISVRMLLRSSIKACWESYLFPTILGIRRAIRWIIASLTNASLLDVVAS